MFHLSLLAKCHFVKNVKPTKNRRLPCDVLPSSAAMNPPFLFHVLQLASLSLDLKSSTRHHVDSRYFSSLRTLLRKHHPYVIITSEELLSHLQSVSMGPRLSQKQWLMAGCLNRVPHRPVYCNGLKCLVCVVSPLMVPAYCFFPPNSLLKKPNPLSRGQYVTSCTPGVSFNLFCFLEAGG